MGTGRETMKGREGERERERKGEGRRKEVEE